MSTKIRSAMRTVEKRWEINLTVRFTSWLQPHYASLEFTAATTKMSGLFERSASVRAVYTDLTVASGGVCCTLDIESDALHVCWLNGQPTQDTVPGQRFPNHPALAATWAHRGR
ncbi:hypothetical protein ACIA78_25260 [Streptomyces xanthochromogenes]|uniref:hypothetical protein n=1 Tax=Streptomyces xanthochromogenes TaxID=67384 RepID=UPI00378B86AC